MNLMLRVIRLVLLLSVLDYSIFAGSRLRRQSMKMNPSITSSNSSDPFIKRCCICIHDMIPAITLSFRLQKRVLRRG